MRNARNRSGGVVITCIVNCTKSCRPALSAVEGAGCIVFISEVDDLIMFAPLDAMFLRTDLTSRPGNSALSRAGNLGDAHLREMSAEMDKSFTMRTYPPTAGARKSLTIRTYKISGLKPVPWNEHLQKTPGGRGLHSPFATFNFQLVP